MLCFEYYFLAFWVVIFVILCLNVLLLVCWVWWIVFDADFIWCLFVGHNVLIFVLCFGVCWFSYSLGKWVWCFSGFYSVFVYESLLVSVVFVCLSCITVFLCCHNMCVLLSWVYYFNTFNFQFVMSHCHLFWLYVVFIVHIRLMIDCLINSYLLVCLTLCSIALSPFCCTCLILYWHDLCLKLCVISMAYIHFWIQSSWYLSFVVLFLVLCCVPILLQMSHRSSKGKDIVTDDTSTPVAKRTRLSS